MTDDKKIRLQELAYKWLRGTLTAEEQLEFDLWFDERDEAPLVIPAEVAESKADYEQLLLSRIKEEIKVPAKGGNTQRLYPFVRRITAAAAAILIIGAAIYLYQQPAGIDPAEIVYAQDVAPGGNKAILTLANGERITLTDAQNGKLAEQAGVFITKTADGNLVYGGSKSKNDTTLLYNTIETPKGGQYALTLPDGSKIWLNADSRIKYPASFAGAAKRRVELIGEAYFEIAKDKEHPFILVTARQDLEVLGTHFNVSSYAGQQAVKTTLLEGSVKLSNKLGSSKILVPGQQASLSKGDAFVLNPNVDLEQVTAWKEGYFKFHDNLETILEQVSRWYDVEIVYEKRPDPKLAFGAELSRSRNVSALLKIIESTGSVHFEIEGRRIIVK